MNLALLNLVRDPFWLVTVTISAAGWIVALVGQVMSNSSDPSNFPTFAWWGLSFQFLVTSLVIYAVMTCRLSMYRPALLSFLSVALIYSTNTTNNFVWRSTSIGGTVAAGQILLSIVNLVWVFFVGTTIDEPIHAWLAPATARRRALEYQRSHRQILSAPGAGANPRRQAAEPHGGAGGSNLPCIVEEERQSVMQRPTTERGSFRDSRSAWGAGLQNWPHRQNSTFSGTSGRSDSLSLPTEYPYRARALYDYSANPDDDNEISFDKNEVLEISDITGRWWQARRANGEVGICPSNYVVLL